MDYLSLTVIIQTQWNKNRKVAHSCQCVPALSLPHMHTHVLTQSHKVKVQKNCIFSSLIPLSTE